MKKSITYVLVKKMAGNQLQYGRIYSSQNIADEVRLIPGFEKVSNEQVRRAIYQCMRSFNVIAPRGMGSGKYIFIH